MERRFRALRTIAVIYKVLAILFAILTVLGVLAMCVLLVIGTAGIQKYSGNTAASQLLGSAAGMVIWAIVSLIWGAFITLTLYAAGDGIDLLIALEENTRATSQALAQWAAGAQAQQAQR